MKENILPLVTIITPLYNSSKYIRETYESVVNQTYTNFEWIIVDDKSTDNSLELVKSFPDKRIILIPLEENAGVANARNIALDHVKGKYVTFLDSDDLLDKNYLEEQVNFIKDNGPIITAGYRRKADNSVTDFLPPKESTAKSILKGNPLSCLSTMFEYNIFKDLRMPVDVTKHEDFVYWENMLLRGYKCKGNQKVLATYRILNTSRNNASKFALLKPMYLIYRKKFHILPIRSLYYLFNMALYSKKKYRNVK